MLRTLIVPLSICFLRFASASHVDNYAAQIEDISKIRKMIGVEDLYTSAHHNLPHVKVAIIDLGFKGLVPRTPDSLRYLPYYEVIDKYEGAPTDPLDENSDHGRLIAQIVYAVSSGSKVGPKIRLYNGASPENFVRATEHLKRWGAQVVVCAINWQTMGNFDGTGFISETVNSAVDSGILWIQAAGNHGGMVLNGTVKIANQRNVYISDSKFFASFNNHLDDSDLEVTLSWNSFIPEKRVEGTDKDLSMCLYEYGNDTPLQCSKEKQVKERKNENDTLYARDTLKITHLPASAKGKPYRIAIFIDNGTFTEKDQFRLTLTPAKDSYLDPEDQKSKPVIEFTNASKEKEIGVPADSRAFTVGDFSQNTSIGPTIDGRQKPDAISDINSFSFASKLSVSGTSFTAAMIGGVVAVLKAIEPELKPEHLLKMRGKLYDDFFEKQGVLISKEKRPFNEATNNFLDSKLGEYNWGITSGRRGIVSLKPFSLVEAFAPYATNPDKYKFFVEEKVWMTQVKKTRDRLERVEGQETPITRTWRDADTGRVIKRETFTRKEPDTWRTVKESYWADETNRATDFKVYYTTADDPSDKEVRGESLTQYIPIKEFAFPRGYQNNNIWRTPLDTRQLRSVLRPR